MGVHTEPSTILPETFLAHGSFKVRRSSGNVSIMIINDKGKTHFDLKKQQVYVDMCDDNRSIFKTVEINERFINDNSELDLVGTALKVGTSAIAEEISTIWRSTVGVLDGSTIAVAPSDLTEVVVDDASGGDDASSAAEDDASSAAEDDASSAADEAEEETTPVPSPTKEPEPEAPEEPAEEPAEAPAETTPEPEAPKPADAEAPKPADTKDKYWW